MHTVIPFALSDDPACRLAAQSLALPLLSRIVQTFSPSPSPLAGRWPTGMALAHEHIRAAQWGLPTAASYPWAALEAAQNGLDAQQAWAYVTPCHWQIAQAQVRMHNPQALALTAPELDTLRTAMQGFFAEDGITLLQSRSGAHWLACGEVFRQLPTAPPERAVGRLLTPWLPPSDLLRRLQNEMQMLLYTHPLHDARSQAGHWPVNSVWFSGSGALPEGYRMPQPAPASKPSEALQNAALNNDWPAWQAAWQTLDNTVLRELLQAAQHGPVQLSLCSEDRAVHLCNHPRSRWQTLRERWWPRGLQPIWNAL